MSKKEKGVPGPAQDRSTNTTINIIIGLKGYKGIGYTIQNRFFKGVYSSIYLNCIDIYIHIQLIKTLTTHYMKNAVIQLDSNCMTI